MGFFSRSKDSANSSASEKAKQPLTTDLYTVPPPGVKPTKKWTYDEDQLAQVRFPSGHSQPAVRAVCTTP